MNLASILSSLLGIIIGGVITWYFARKYYVQASLELLEESKKLKLTSDLILYKLQHTDVKTSLKYNEKGEVSGLTIDMSAHI